MKLLSWNVQWCRGMDGKVLPARIVAEAIRLADPDVICLQEIAAGFSGLAGSHGEDQVAAIADLLPGWHVAFGAAVDETVRNDGSGRSRRRRFGNLIATRLDVRLEQHHPLPIPVDPGVPAMPRMCSLLTVAVPGLGPVRIMTTHLEYYSDRQRLAQAQALRDLHAAQCRLAGAPPKTQGEAPDSPFGPKAWTRHAVLCGDFNAQADGPEYQALTCGERDAGSAFSDAWQIAHPDRARPGTFRLHEPDWVKGPVSCDFVFVSESLRDAVRSCDVDIDNLASDHQPVWVELQGR